MKTKSYKIIMILAIIIPILFGIVGGIIVLVKFNLFKDFFSELSKYVNSILYSTIGIIIFLTLYFILKTLNRIRLKLEKIYKNGKN